METTTKSSAFPSTTKQHLSELREQVTQLGRELEAYRAYSRIEDGIRLLEVVKGYIDETAANLSKEIPPQVKESTPSPIADRVVELRQWLSLKYTPIARLSAALNMFLSTTKPGEWLSLEEVAKRLDWAPSPTERQSERFVFSRLKRVIDARLILVDQSPDRTIRLSLSDEARQLAKEEVLKDFGFPATT